MSTSGKKAIVRYIRRSRRNRVEVPAWHLEILRERLAELEANPDAGQPWDEFLAELRAELRARRRGDV